MLEKIKDWYNDNSKAANAVILAVCLVITVIVTLIGANGKKNEVSTGVFSSTDTVTEETIVLQEVPLAENTDAQISTLISDYFTALAGNDMEKMNTIVRPVSEEFKVRTKEISAYVDSYSEMKIYSKPGPDADSAIVYAYTKQILKDYADKPVAGLTTFYICKDENGNYYINMAEELPEEITDYIRTVTLQDDVIELNNEVTVEFNNLLSEDEKFANYYATLSNDIQNHVTAAMAESRKETTSAGGEDKPVETVEPVSEIVRATSVVNMRASDSENADKVGKAQIDDTFLLLEQKANGWSKVLYDGKEVYMKSEYLEPVGGTAPSAPEQPQEPEQQPQQPEEQQEPEQQPQTASVNSNLGESGYVKAKETINIRASASETGEKLGVAYPGDRLEYVMNQADGWCKVKYKGKTAYVKAEYVE